jgi:hypothetical protein
MHYTINDLLATSRQNGWKRGDRSFLCYESVCRLIYQDLERCREENLKFKINKADHLKEN